MQGGGGGAVGGTTVTIVGIGFGRRVGVGDGITGEGWAVASAGLGTT